MPEMQFIMRWKQLNKQVRVASVEHNQEIFDWFIKNLPTLAFKPLRLWQASPCLCLMFL